MKLKSIIAMGFIGASIATMSGCALIGAPTDSATKTSAQKFAPTDPNSVIIYSDGSKPSQAYVVIGQENIDATEYYMPRSQSKILAAMRSQAAKLGGQAVININTAMMGTTATVIRFKTDADAQAALKEAQEKGLVMAVTPNK